MGAFRCCSGAFASFSRAAAKSAASRLRQLGLLPQAVDWARRSAICETCHMRIIHKDITYCGQPFLEKITRDLAVDGCGCPTLAKAKDPAEHCPLDWTNHPARQLPDGCTCKWCHARQ